MLTPYSPSARPGWASIKRSALVLAIAMISYWLMKGIAAIANEAGGFLRIFYRRRENQPAEQPVLLPKQSEPSSPWRLEPRVAVINHSLSSRSRCPKAHSAVAFVVASRFCNAASPRANLSFRRRCSLCPPPAHHPPSVPVCRRPAGNVTGRMHFPFFPAFWP